MRTSAFQRFVLALVLFGAGMAVGALGLRQFVPEAKAQAAGQVSPVLAHGCFQKHPHANCTLVPLAVDAEGRLRIAN